MVKRIGHSIGSRSPWRLAGRRGSSRPKFALPRAIVVGIQIRVVRVEAQPLGEMRDQAELEAVGLGLLHVLVEAEGLRRAARVGTPKHETKSIMLRVSRSK